MAAVEDRGSMARIILTDGSSLEVPPEIRLRHSLFEGSPLAQETLELIRREALILQAERRGIALLARSSHTVRGLGRKLEQRGFPADVVRHVLSRLQELGYLDDRQAAQTWLRQRIERHPEGRALLLAGLLKRGIPRELAEELVRLHVPDEVERENAARVLRNLYPSDGSRRRLASGPERVRACRRLAARGFSLPEIRRVLPAPAEDSLQDDLGE